VTIFPLYVIKDIDLKFRNKLNKIIYWLALFQNLDIVTICLVVYIFTIFSYF